jgi:hypothetical protein
VVVEEENGWKKSQLKLLKLVFLVWLYGLLHEPYHVHVELVLCVWDGDVGGLDHESHGEGGVVDKEQSEGQLEHQAL